MATATQAATIHQLETLTPAPRVVKTPELTSFSTSLSTTTPLPSSIMNDIFQQSNENSRANLYGEIPQQHYGEVTTDLECVHSGQYGLRIVNTKPHSWGGYWVIVFADEPFNISEFNALNFWIKGQSGKENVTIGVAMGYGADPSSTSNLNVEISASEWRLASVPLSIFGDPSSLVKSVAGIYFTLAANDEKQNICIDDVAFVK